MRDGPAVAGSEGSGPDERDWASAELGIGEEQRPPVRPPPEDRGASPLSIFLAPLVTAVVVFGAVVVGEGVGEGVAAAAFLAVVLLALLSGVTALVFSVAVLLLRRRPLVAHLAAGVVGALLVGSWPFFGGVTDVADVGAFPFVIGGAYLAVALLSLLPSALARVRSDGI